MVATAAATKGSLAATITSNSSQLQGTQPLATYIGKLFV